MMRGRCHGAGWVALLLLLLPLSACLEWDEQEVSIAFDAERDQLEVQLVYRGLCSAESSAVSSSESSADAGADSASARDPQGGEETRARLAELVGGHPSFALVEPWWELDLAALREASDPRVAWIMARIEVDHGEFFRDEAGRWCAWQHVRVRQVSEVVALAGTLLREELAERRARGGEDDDGLLALLGLDDRDSRERQQPALAVPFAWLVLRGRTLALRVPASARGARELSSRLASAREWNDQVAAWQAARDEPTNRAPGAEASSTPAGAIAGKAERTELAAAERTDVDAEFLWALARTLRVEPVATTFGVELQLELPALAAEPWKLRSSCFRAADVVDLTPHLAAVHAPIRAGVDAAFLAAEFAAFRAR